MPVTISKTLLQLAKISQAAGTNAGVRDYLGIDSSEEVDAKIDVVLNDVDDISGNVVYKATSLIPGKIAVASDDHTVTTYDSLSFTPNTLTVGNGISGSEAAFILNVPTPAGSWNRNIYGKTAGSNRWILVPGDSTAETGSDAGSNFQLKARTDAGGGIDSPITIARAAGGNITLVRPLSTSGNITQTGADSIFSATSFAPTNTSGSIVQAAWTLSANPLSGSSASYFGNVVSTGSNAACAQNLTATIGLNAGNFTVNHFGSGTLSAGYAVRGIFNLRSGGGNVTTAAGYSSIIQNLGASLGTVAAAYQAEAATNTGGGGYTRLHGFYSLRQTAGTNNFGFFYGTSAGTGNWGFYNNTSDGNYFGTGATLINSTTDDGINKLQVTGSVKVTTNGTAAAPAVNFGLSEVHGFYRISSSAVGLSINGSSAIQLGSASIQGQIISGGSYSYGTSVTDGAGIFMAGSSTSNGGQIRTYGSTHATKPNYVEFNRGSTVEMFLDDSGILTHNTTTDASSVNVAAHVTLGGHAVTKRSFLGNTANTTFAGNVLAGVMNATAAISGQVGEVYENNTSTAVNAASTGTYLALCTIVLPPGNWEIHGNAQEEPGSGATHTVGGALEALIGNVSASSSGATRGKDWVKISHQITPSDSQSLYVRKIVNISATTTYYLNCLQTYTLGTAQWRGSLNALRIR